ncbi:laccase 5 [Coprinopsis cinerea AmutBmut pab1-1]|nr:laccase 5 [Coprinopsis cinerea AmutBmut pab1-1]
MDRSYSVTADSEPDFLMGTPGYAFSRCCIKSFNKKLRASATNVSSAVNRRPERNRIQRPGMRARETQVLFLGAPSINTTIAPPVNATLINGKGRQPVKPDSPLAIVNVKQGKRYRFRILSLSCDPNYNFSIDGHDLTVIEADGQLTRKLVVQRLQIFACQRYSVILHANRPKGNYWIRAEPNFGVGLNGTSGTKANGVNSATLA